MSFLARLRPAAAAALLLGAAAVGGPVTSAAAAAAPCPGTSGVTVVVDFHELGGGIQQVCEPDGGGGAADRLFPAAGYPLTYVQRFPGFVCRVSDLPAEDPCVNTPPADAYWGLWWSDGRSGEWQYASVGVGSLTIPAGGYVALSWDAGSGLTLPGVDPTAHATPTPTPAPTPAPTPTPTATRTPTQAPTKPPTDAPSPTATPTSSPTDITASPTPQPSTTKPPRPSETGRPSDSPTPTATPTGEVTEAAGPVDGGGVPPDDGGLPGWVPPVLVLALLAAAGCVTVLRRRS